jgi:hypothetical protein
MSPSRADSSNELKSRLNLARLKMEPSWTEPNEWAELASSFYAGHTSEVPTANWIPRAPVGRGTRGSCIPRSHNHRQRTRPSLINFGYWIANRTAVETAREKRSRSYGRSREDTYVHTLTAANNNTHAWSSNRLSESGRRRWSSNNIQSTATAQQIVVANLRLQQPHQRTDGRTDPQFLCFLASLVRRKSLLFVWLVADYRCEFVLRVK